MPPEFEYDSLKSLANLIKHGAFLGDAKALWEDPRKVLTRTHRGTDQFRAYALGLYQGKVWKAVFTLRAGKIRLVSFHPANRQGRAAYFRRRV